MRTARNKKNDGERILRQMFHKCVFQNYLGSMTLMINTAIDGMIISHFLGGQATVAFGLIFPIYSLLNFIPILLRTSTQVNLGKFIGRGDIGNADRCVFYLLAFGFVAAVPLLLLLTAFRNSALMILSVQAQYSETTLSLASDYLLWLAPSVLPCLRLLLAGCHSLALHVGTGHLVLSLVVALLCRLAVPSEGCRVVLFHAVPLVIAAAHAVLGFLVSFLRSGLQLGQCSGVVFGFEQCLAFGVKLLGILCAGCQAQHQRQRQKNLSHHNHRF